MKLFKEKKDCCGCSACVNICPNNALKMKRDNEGFEYPYVNKDECVRCGLCVQVCPVKVSQQAREQENNKKHIGIINLQYTDNYGAVVAAAALEDTIRCLVDESYIVQTIDYNPQKQFSNRFLKALDQIKMNGGIKLYLRSLFLENDNGWAPHKRISQFKSFRYNFLNLSPRYTNSYDINKEVNYVAFITGSDIVWGPKRTDSYRSEGYYLKFADKGEKKIAFAPSIDHKVDKKLQCLSRRYKENLKYLDFISVREKSNVDFIQKLTDKKVSVCCDPVFLAKSGYYDKMIDVAQVNPEKQRYIYVYILETNQDIVDYANKLAYEKNLKIYFYSQHHKDYLCDSHDCTSDGPSEFLYRLKNAEYVLSNSFHCVVFSLLFRKKFLSFTRSAISIKTIDLLDTFNLKNRIATDNPNIDETIDFNAVDKKIEEIRESSLMYLKQALREIE